MASGLTSRLCDLPDCVKQAVGAAGSDLMGERLDLCARHLENLERELSLHPGLRRGDWQMILDLAQIERSVNDDNEHVPEKAACPQCGERQADCLTINDEDSVDCATCGNHYHLPPKEEG